MSRFPGEAHRSRRDHVAGCAVVLTHGALADVRGGLLRRRDHLRALDLVVDEPDDEGRDRTDLFRFEVEPGHAQLLGRVLDLPAVEGARLVDFLLEPALAVVLELVPFVL